MARERKRVLIRYLGYNYVRDIRENGQRYNVLLAIYDIKHRVIVLILLCTSCIPILAKNAKLPLAFTAYIHYLALHIANLWNLLCPAKITDKNTIDKNLITNIKLDHVCAFPLSPTPYTLYMLL